MPDGGSARISVLWHTGTACTFPAGTFDPGSAVSAVGVWTTSSGMAEAPAGTQSAFVRVGDVTTATDTGEFDVNFDEVIFQERMQVPALPPALLALLGILLAAAALSAARWIRTGARDAQAG